MQWLDLNWNPLNCLDAYFKVTIRSMYRTCYIINTFFFRYLNYMIAVANITERWKFKVNCWYYINDRHNMWYKNLFNDYFSWSNSICVTLLHFLNYMIVFVHFWAPMWIWQLYKLGWKQQMLSPHVENRKFLSNKLNKKSFVLDLKC